MGEYQCPVLMVVPNSNGHNGGGGGGGTGKPAVAAAVTAAVVKKAESGGKKLRFQLAKERKASTTLGIIMSAFTVCWLPFFVLALVRPFLSEPSSIPSSLSSLFLWLGYANSLLNPVSTLDPPSPPVARVCTSISPTDIYVVAKSPYVKHKKMKPYTDYLKNYVISSSDCIIF